MIVVLELLLFGGALYWIYEGCPGTTRGMLSVVICLFAAHAAYQDAKRWRVRFAYFDPHGAAQESADEIATAGWKPGDGCVAVFRPERPDIATFRPCPAA